MRSEVVPGHLRFGRVTRGCYTVEFVSLQSHSDPKFLQHISVSDAELIVIVFHGSELIAECS
jgi:hypothetical protein